MKLTLWEYLTVIPKTIRSQGQIATPDDGRELYRMRSHCWRWSELSSQETRCTKGENVIPLRPALSCS